MRKVDDFSIGHMGHLSPSDSTGIISCATYLVLLQSGLMIETKLSLPSYTPTLASFRAEEFLRLTERLLTVPIEQDQDWLNAAPFRLEAPEPLPEAPLPILPPRWYPRPAPDIVDAARASLVPPPRPAFFEGRAQTLERILRPLLAGKPITLPGAPGSGKSALLAVVAAHERTRQRFRRIWWIDEPARWEQTLALALNLPHMLRDSQAKRDALERHLDEHTLLIVDNLQPDDALLAELPQLTPHVLLAVETPPLPVNPEEALPDDPDGIVTLRALDDTPAVETLAHYAGIDDTRRVRGDLLRVAHALGNLPYALMTVGQLVQRDGMPLGEVLELVERPLNETTSDEVEIITEDIDPVIQQAAALQRVLDVSLGAMPGEYRALFEAFGAFPLSGAPLDGLLAAANIDNPIAGRRGLVMLAQYGFITPDDRMHPVVYGRADVSAGKNAASKRAKAWAQRYIRMHSDDPLMLYRAETSLLHAIREDQRLLRGYLLEYHPGALEKDRDAEPEATGIRAEGVHLTQMGIELTDQEAYSAAEEALQKALEIRKAHDSAHAAAETLVALARLYDLTERYGQATEALIEAAELVFNLSAADSLSVVRRGLARVYRHMGRLNDAIGVLDDTPNSHLERALALRAQGNYAAAVNEMNQAEDATPYARAELLLLAGRYGEALSAIAGEDDPAAAHLRAQIYHLQGAVEEAIQGYQIALDCCAANNPARAKTLRGLGAALATSGDLDGALAVFQEALDLQRAENNPLLVGRTLRLIAAVYAISGEDEPALQAANEAIQALNHAPSDAADAYRTLGRVRWRQGNFEEALQAFTAEVEQAQGISERDEMRIGVALHHFADAYRAVGQLDRAVANYRRALTHKNASKEPTSYLITQLALQRALMEQGRLPGAMEVAQEIVDLLQREPMPDLQQMGYAQAIRARTQQAIQRPIRAGQSLMEWAHLLANRGPEAVNDPRTGLQVLVLGLAVRSLIAENRPALALEVAERGLKVAEAHYPDSPAAWAARRDLGEVLGQLERWEDVILTLEPLLNPDISLDNASRALAHELSGRGYRKLGDSGEALRHLREALEVEPEPHLRGLMHATAGDILLDTGQPASAIESYQRALEHLPRKDYPDEVARILTTVAHTLGGLNRYAEAIGVYEDALIGLRDVEGVSPVHTADVLKSLGQTHEAQGQLNEAARAYRRALNVLEKADAPRQYRDILHLLARVTAAVGDQSAVQIYEQTRDLTREWGDARELGEVLGELADVHRDAGRLPFAIQNYQLALECLTVTLFARDRAQILRSLGRAYAQMERYDEARDAWTEALDISAELPDETPLEVALTHHAIGEAHRHQKHYDDAERSYREALHYHTPGTTAAANTWRALGQALYAAERYDAAIDTLHKALEAEKAQPQQANARLVQTLQLMAAAQEARGDLMAAVARHHEALVYMDRRLQPVAYADTLRTLGVLYGRSHHYEEAHKAYQDALEIEGDHVPRSDERISATLQAIADLYRVQGDLEKAAEYYQKVTVYNNLTRRASDDLKETLDELERRRATLQAALQSLALLDRSDNASLKDLAFIYALIAKAYASLNQPQESADTINTLLDTLVDHQDELRIEDEQPDMRAMAWLAEVRKAQDAEDMPTAQDACRTSLQAVRNVNLRWVIEQMTRALA